jgi:hypothetical protein
MIYRVTKEPQEPFLLKFPKVLTPLPPMTLPQMPQPRLVRTLLFSLIMASDNGVAWRLSRKGDSTSHPAVDSHLPKSSLYILEDQTVPSNMKTSTQSHKKQKNKETQHYQRNIVSSNQSQRHRGDI